MMSTDAFHLSTPATAKTDAVIVAVNQEPVDSGIRLPVEHVSLDDLHRRQPADVAAPPLPGNVDVLQAMIAELRQALADQKQRNTELEQAMDALLRRLQRTPRDAWPACQPPLFPEAQANAATPADEPPETLPESNLAAATSAEPGLLNPKKNKKGHGRRSLEELLKSLPLQRREHALTEAERVCPCCGRPRRHIGEQTSQQLEYIPAKLVCVQHAQFTYSCPHCPEHIVTAPKPPQPIDRGLAGPGLCALVAASKFDDYLPLYRQELT